jgi:hypothetical protein
LAATAADSKRKRQETMMAKITVVTSNSKMIGLHPIYRHDEIDSAVEEIKAQLHDLLDKDTAQTDFMKRHKLISNDIVWDFNGDMLYLAMCLRDVYNDDLSDNLQWQEDIQAIGDGLIKPSKHILSEFSRMLKFPEDFFLREGTVSRNGEGIFACKMPSWAGDDCEPSPAPPKFVIQQLLEIS